MSEPLSTIEKGLPPRYERRDVDAVSLVLLVVLLLVAGGLVEMVVAGMLSVLTRRAVPASNAPPHEIATPQFPEPRLQVSPPADLRALRTREDALLHAYGWVDRKAGIIHIPIDRAMDLLVERGLPQTSESVTSVELLQRRPEQNPPRDTVPKEDAP